MIREKVKNKMKKKPKNIELYLRDIMEAGYFNFLLNRIFNFLSTVFFVINFLSKVERVEE